MMSVLNTAPKATMLLRVSECLSQIKWVYFNQKPQSRCELQSYDYASRVTGIHRVSGTSGLLRRWPS